MQKWDKNKWKHLGFDHKWAGENFTWGYSARCMSLSQTATEESSRWMSHLWVLEEADFCYCTAVKRIKRRTAFFHDTKDNRRKKNVGRVQLRWLIISNINNEDYIFAEQALVIKNQKHVQACWEISNSLFIIW